METDGYSLSFNPYKSIENKKPLKVSTCEVIINQLLINLNILCTIEHEIGPETKITIIASKIRDFILFVFEFLLLLRFLAISNYWSVVILLTGELRDQPLGKCVKLKCQHHSTRSVLAFFWISNLKHLLFITNCAYQSN